MAEPTDAERIRTAFESLVEIAKGGAQQPSSELEELRLREARARAELAEFELAHRKAQLGDLSQYPVPYPTSAAADKGSEGS